MMQRRSFIGLVAALAALSARQAAGQRRNNLRRVAIVFVAPAADVAGTDLYFRQFVDALREQGIVDGRNIIIERRSAEHRPELAAVMKELVARDVDVIVTFGPGASVAQRATDRIPIVALVDDALEAGLIASLARPGGNMTGFGSNFPGLLGKDLQVLKEAIPTISRVGVVSTTTVLRDSGRYAIRPELDAAGSSMKLDMRWVAVDAPAEFELAFATMVREQADAVFVTGVAFNYAHLRRIADLAMAHRMPSFFEAREFVEFGGLLSYGWSAAEIARNGAAYVRKILDGAKPGDLPWSQPTKLELVINLRTAKALGLTIPKEVLLRADEVIQ
jgi:putative ABC transport system substrate-binding protein